jgi:CheY-like chemotaxis protein
MTRGPAALGFWLRGKEPPEGQNAPKRSPATACCMTGVAVSAQARIVHGRTSAMPQGATKTRYEDRAQRTPRRIVLAEDNAAMRRLMVRALEQDGYDLVEAATGLDLVEELHRARDTGRVPALIVSDIRLPGCSGLAVLRTIRSWGWRVPMILVTAFGSDQMLDEAFQLDATAVLMKPFDLDDLRSAVTCFMPGEPT